MKSHFVITILDIDPSSGVSSIGHIRMIIPVIGGAIAGP